LAAAIISLVAVVEQKMIVVPNLSYSYLLITSLLVATINKMTDDWIIFELWLLSILGGIYVSTFDIILLGN